MKRELMEGDAEDTASRESVMKALIRRSEARGNEEGGGSERGWKETQKSR